MVEKVLCFTLLFSLAACTEFVSAMPGDTDSSSTDSGPDSDPTTDSDPDSDPTTNPSSTVTGGSGGGGGSDDTSGSESTGDPDTTGGTGEDSCMAITPTTLLELFDLKECLEVLPESLCDLPDMPLTRGEFTSALVRFSPPFQLAGFHRDITNNFGSPDPRFADVSEDSSLWLSVQPFYWRGVFDEVYSQKEEDFGPDELACLDWYIQVWENYEVLSELYCVFSDEYSDFDVGINSGFWNVLELACFGTLAVFDGDGELDLSESRLLATEEAPLEVQNDPGEDGTPDPESINVMDGLRFNCLNGSGGGSQILDISFDGIAEFEELPCYMPDGLEDEDGLTIRLQGSTGPERAFDTQFALDILFPDTVELIEGDPGVHRTVVTLVESP